MRNSTDIQYIVQFEHLDVWLEGSQVPGWTLWKHFFVSANFNMVIDTNRPPDYLIWRNKLSEKKELNTVDVSQAASNINTFNTVHFSQIEVSVEHSLWARYLKPLRVCVIEQDKRNWVWQTSSISATQKWDNEMHTPPCQHSWRQVFYFESGCSKSGGKVILTEIWNLGVISSTQLTFNVLNCL